MKEELLKQNGLPHLLKLTYKLHGDLLALLLEIIWSLAFLPDAARDMRCNAKFLEEIQKMSKNNEGNEAIKKASAGILWKIVQGTARKIHVTII